MYLHVSRGAISASNMKVGKGKNTCISHRHTENDSLMIVFPVIPLSWYKNGRAHVRGHIHTHARTHTHAHTHTHTHMQSLMGGHMCRVLGRPHKTTHLSIPPSPHTHTHRHTNPHTKCMGTCVCSHNNTALHIPLTHQSTCTNAHVHYTLLLRSLDPHKCFYAPECIAYILLCTCTFVTTHTNNYCAHTKINKNYEKMYEALYAN